MANTCANSKCFKRGYAAGINAAKKKPKAQSAKIKEIEKRLVKIRQKRAESERRLAAIRAKRKKKKTST